MRYKIAFNVDTMQPGCALLQAAHECSTGIANAFPSEMWQLHSEGLRIYEIDDEQLGLLVHKVEKLHHWLQLKKANEQKHKVWVLDGVTYVAVELTTCDETPWVSVRLPNGKERSLPKNQVFLKQPVVPAAKERHVRARGSSW